MKRCLHIDYQKLEGAKTHKRVLHLLPEDGIQQETYVCPVGTCLHDPYKSVRGLRKHINSIHPWYFYFDEPPRIQRKARVSRGPTEGIGIDREEASGDGG